MGKIKTELKRHLKQYIITTIIAIFIGVLIFILFYFLRQKSLIDAVNGVTIAFISLLSLGILIWAGSQGGFDLVAYGFKQLGSAAFSKKPNKHHDYGSYVQDKRAKRSHDPKIYLPFIIVAFLFGIILIVLEIIFHTK